METSAEPAPIMARPARPPETISGNCVPTDRVRAIPRHPSPIMTKPATQKLSPRSRPGRTGSRPAATSADRTRKVLPLDIVGFVTEVSAQLHERLVQDFELLATLDHVLAA